MSDPKLALFDFDGTMIKGDSIRSFLRFSYDEGLLSIPSLLKILWNTILWRAKLLPVEKLKTSALKHLQQLDEQAAFDLGRRFVKDRLLPRVYPDAIQQMRMHREEGRVVLIVSASPEFYIRHLKDLLAINDALGTKTNQRYEVTLDLNREKKPERIKQWLHDQGITADFAGSRAYGDSVNDFSMFSLVGQPFLVNGRKNAKERQPQLPQLHWAKSAR